MGLLGWVAKSVAKRSCTKALIFASNTLDKAGVKRKATLLSKRDKLLLKSKTLHNKAKTIEDKANKLKEKADKY